MGHAFPCFCTPDRLEKVRQEQMKNKQNPRYDGTCRNLDPDEGRRRVASGEKHVIRFKMPKEGNITATDLLRGSITTENSALDDSVLLKSDGLPTYHLAAMVDDHLMEITHVIRGSEWLPSLASPYAYHPCLWMGRAAICTSLGFSQTQRKRQDEQT